MGLEAALKAPVGDLTTEIKQPVHDFLRLGGDDHPRALLFERVPGRHVLQRKEFATGQPQTPFDKGPGMHMQRNRPTAIRSANQLDGFDQPFRMVEMAMRQHEGLDPPEIEVHVPAIPLEGIGIRARAEEHGAGFPLAMRGDRQAQPMVGRTERLACELRHPRVHEDAQLGGDVLGTTGEHIRCVIHHNVDGQLVYMLYIYQPIIIKAGISVGPWRPELTSGRTLISEHLSLESALSATRRIENLGGGATPRLEERCEQLHPVFR
jgi:hypothetical protein